MLIGVLFSEYDPQAGEVRDRSHKCYRSAEEAAAEVRDWLGADVRLYCKQADSIIVPATAREGFLLRGRSVKVGGDLFASSVIAAMAKLEPALA